MKRITVRLCYALIIVGVVGVGLYASGAWLVFSPWYWHDGTLVNVATTKDTYGFGTEFTAIRATVQLADGHTVETIWQEQCPTRIHVGQDVQLLIQEWDGAVIATRTPNATCPRTHSPCTCESYYPL